MFNREHIGKHNVQMCGTTPCKLRGSDDIIAAVTNHLGVRCGESTPDGLFHVMEVECLGACVNAPMVQINDDFYEDLTPKSIVKVLDNIKAGKPNVIGPQNGRRGCEGPQGRTTLMGEIPGPYCRDLSPPPPAAEDVNRKK
jgi:NADH dehydrogenase (ubiquinone) flavoprotein 2